MQMVSDSILFLICQISIEEIDFFVALELEETWFLFVLLFGLVFFQNTVALKSSSDNSCVL